MHFFMKLFHFNSIDLESSATKQTSGGSGTGGSHYSASTGKLGSAFLHDNGQQQRTMVHVRSRGKHQGL